MQLSVYLYHKREHDNNQIKGGKSMYDIEVLLAKREASEQCVHPVATRRFIVYLDANNTNRNEACRSCGTSERGERDVFVMEKGGCWFASIYYSGPGGIQTIRYTDDILESYLNKNHSVLAIMLTWKNSGDQIACHFHAEVYDIPSSDQKTIKELVFQMQSRHFCPTDEAYNIIQSMNAELNLELKEASIIRKDLFKQSEEYHKQLTKRVGNIMQSTRSLTEETYISATEELKNKSKEISDMIEKIYGDSYNSIAREQRMALLLVDAMIDRLVDSVYQQGIDRSNKKLAKAIATVEAIAPPEINFKVSRDYISLKKKQLALAYDIEVYKRKQKDDRRRQMEAEREERRAQKELEKELKRAEKDEMNAQAAIERNKFEMAKAKTDEQTRKFQEQISKLEEALRQAQERKERALSMAQQTKCGYVYIISNIGSFGEDVYKIGMTRRVEPMERIAELSSASVPFPFDVHAMIYTEDAPGLEAALHRAFESKKVNAVNWRKEYFHASLSDIKKQVKKFGIDCEWVEKPLAGQYRDTLTLKENK